ncbi:MAG TPA: hypothetical protein P5159_08745 [Phycisphaerae bacterium]|nr:hypothetical protein [Phycisphaerae bacterium]
MDILTMLLELWGFPRKDWPPVLDGQSLVPLLRGDMGGAEQRRFTSGPSCAEASPRQLFDGDIKATKPFAGPEQQALRTHRHECILAKPHPKGACRPSSIAEAVGCLGRCVLEINLHDALTLATLVVTVNSTVAAAAAWRNKPVVQPGAAFSRTRTSFRTTIPDSRWRVNWPRRCACWVSSTTGIVKRGTMIRESRPRPSVPAWQSATHGTSRSTIPPRRSSSGHGAAPTSRPGLADQVISKARTGSDSADASCAPGSLAPAANSDTLYV